MRKIVKLLAGAAGLTLLAGSAFAADMPAVVAPPPMVVVPPPAPAGYNWGGLYAGTYFGDYIGFAWQAGGTIGFNVQHNSLVFGGQGTAGIDFNNSGHGFDFRGTARIGVAVGAQQRALLY